MKEKCYLTIIVLLVFLSLKAQKINHSITYTVNIVRQLDNKTQSSYMDEVYAIAEKTSVQFELLISGSESIFKVKNEIAEKTFDTKIAYIIYGAMDKFYINLEDSEFIHQIQAYNDLFLIPIEKRPWEVSKDSKKIGEYICYKATTTYSTTNSVGTFHKHVTAWYTPEIKGSFGPRGYYGLPGLILQLRDDKLLFTATDISLSQKKKIEIIKPKEGKQISLREFNDLGKIHALDWE